MASYTSVASGDFTTPATWGSATSYPGDGSGGDGDTFTVAAGHTVTVTVDGTPADLGAGTVSGTLTFSETAGTQRLRIAGTAVLTVASGGTLRMDASDAGVRHELDLHSSADGACGLSVQDGGAVYLRGRGKTVATETGAGLVVDATSLAVLDDTGWEPGDVVGLVKDRTTYETAELSSREGEGLWTLSSGLGRAYPAGCAVWNLTRSVRVRGTHPSHDATVTLASGAVASSLECVEFSHLDEVRLTCPATVRGCVARELESSEMGFINGAGGNTYVDCVGWSSEVVALFYQSGTDATYIRCRGLCPAAGASVFRLGSGGARLEGCEAVGYYGINADHPVECTGCRLWGCRYGLYGSRQGHLCVCVFGVDPGGNPAAVDFALHTVRGPVVLDDCYVAQGESPGLSSSLAVVRSLNHGSVGGVTREWQYKGTCESDAAQRRGASGYCDKVDPSSATEPFRYYVSFPCAAGASPALTFYAKATVGLGPVVVRLGRHRCGLTAVACDAGSLDAEGKLSPTTEYALQTVLFQGVTAYNGQVEVCLEVYDESGGLLYLDDFSVSGNA